MKKEGAGKSKNKGTSQFRKAHARLQFKLSQRKRMEESLRLYGKIVDNMVEGIYLIRTTDGFIVYANPKFEEMFGYGPGELVGRNVSIVNAPTDKSPEQTAREITEVLNQSGEWFGEVYNIKKDGTPFWCHASVSTFEHHEFGKVWVSIHQDITERKEAEEALRRKSEELDRYFRSSLDLLIIADTDGYIHRLNPEWEKTLGYPVSEMEGKRFLDFIHPEDLNSTLEAVGSLAQQKEVLNFINRYRCKDGGYRWIEWRGYPEGKLIYAIGRDITDRKKVEDKLKRAKEELEIEVAERTADLREANERLQSQLTERKQTEEQILKRNRELSLLYTIDRTVGRSLNLNEILSSALEATLNTLGIEAGGIFLLEQDGETMTFRVHRGVSGEFVKSVQRIKMGEGISGRAVAEKRPIILDVSEYPTERLAPFIVAEGFKTLASTPLLAGGELVGAMNLGTPRVHAFPSEELELLTAIGQQLGMAIQNARLYEKVQQELTERKQAEEALRMSEERFHQLYDEAPIGYHEIDKQGRITRVNLTELEMLGYTAEEMLGQPAWRFIVEEVSQEAVKAKLAGTLPAGRAFERTYRKKDGTTFPVLITERVLWDAEGRIVGIRSTIQDITERKRAEEEMTALQEQLRQSQRMEAIGRLAGGVAHDFNNLLTIIKGNSQLSLMELKEGDPARENLEGIQKASERASDLIRQLLAFSRRQVMEVKVLDLNILLKDLDKMLHRLIGEDIDLVTLLAEDLGRIKVDPGQIEQVIMNLAVNARDAMPSGGKLTIETANVELDKHYARNHIAVTPGRYVMLSVSDTGVGITPEVREHLFEPFFTTKEKGKGTGLGLSTVYGIVKQSGGNIWVYSEPGRGATFKIYLPRVDEPLEELSGKDASGEVPRGSETILVVEDEEEVRKLTARILQKNGYSVLEAPEGGNALQLCEEHKGPIDLLVTDVVMPKMSGRELAERLTGIHPEMKVLYMSGYTDNAIAHHGILVKGVEYIQKPFTADGLARKVREVLDK